MVYKCVVLWTWFLEEVATNVTTLASRREGSIVVELKTPRGLAVSVPETEDEDPSPKFDIHDIEGFRRYYSENGYAVIGGLFTPAQCDGLKALWDREVKPYDGFMYRQATAKVEKHIKNSQGWIMNAILNPQSVDPHHFPGFRAYVTSEILGETRLNAAFAGLLQDTPKIVQSIYFEGNSATWEHQDSYYLDSETVGEMAAGWIALEDIAPRAGRFFICPKSHKIALDTHAVHNSIAEYHERYIVSVVQKIREAGLTIRAPKLDKGDVLFWNAWTIHGSLDTQDAARSRSSITCHAIPTRKKLLQMQSRTVNQPTVKVRETYINRPKDLQHRRNRAIFFVESHLPRFFYWLKKRAIIYVLKHKSV